MLNPLNAILQCELYTGFGVTINDLYSDLYSLTAVAGKI